MMKMNKYSFYIQYFNQDPKISTYRKHDKKKKKKTTKKKRVHNY